jgi:O-antigen ligase
MSIEEHAGLAKELAGIGQGLRTLLLICLISVVALVTGLAAGGGIDSKVAAGVFSVLLFAILVWDIRVIVPILILTLPFGPRFASSVGNIYLSTALLVITYAAWIVRKSLPGRSFSLFVNGVVPYVGIFMVAILVPALQHLPFLMGDPTRSLRIVQFVLYTGLFIIVSDMSMSKRTARWLLILLVAAGVGQGLLGMVQWMLSPGIYVSGTFDWSHANFSAYVTLMLFIVLGVVLETRRSSVALLFLAGLAILLHSTVFSYSRTAYMAIVGSFVVVMFLPVPPWKRLSILAATLLGVAFFFVTARFDLILRVRSIYETLSGKQIATSVLLRFDLWRTALSDFLESPILGKGTWRYNLRDNYVIKLLGETGLVGFSAFAILIYAILREQIRLLRLRLDDEIVRGIALGMVPATVGTLIIHNLAGDIFVVHRLMGSFWIGFALLLKYAE